MIVPRTTTTISSAGTVSTGWPSLPALTTIFTPPASCSDLPFTYTNSEFWRDAALQQTDCYPPLFLPPPQWNEYSPGVCPAQYTPNILSQRITYSNGEVETYAFCCPFSMEMITVITTESLTSLSTSSTFKCAQLISTPTWYINGSQTVSTSGYFTAFASGMWAEWEGKDLSLFTPASAPILGFADAFGTSTRRSSSSATGSSSRNFDPRPSGLSTGAKAGIGVGVGIFVLLLLGVALWFMRRHHERRTRIVDEPTAKQIPELDQKADILEAPDFARRHEAAGSSTDPEKRVHGDVAELEGNWHGHEFEDTSRKPGESVSRSSSIAKTPARFFRPRDWL